MNSGNNDNNKQDNSNNQGKSGLNINANSIDKPKSFTPNTGNQATTTPNAPYSGTITIQDTKHLGNVWMNMPVDAYGNPIMNQYTGMSPCYNPYMNQAPYSYTPNTQAPINPVSEKPIVGIKNKTTKGRQNKSTQNTQPRRILLLKTSRKPQQPQQQNKKKSLLQGK